MAKPVKTDSLAELHIEVKRKPKRRKIRRGEASAKKPVRISATILARYAGLADIPPDEWYEFFPNTGKPWTKSEREYLVQWWGKDDILSLSYALGRPPWGLQREVSRLRKAGVHIGYQRGDAKRE